MIAGTVPLHAWWSTQSQKNRGIWWVAPQVRCILIVSGPRIGVLKLVCRRCGDGLWVHNIYTRDGQLVTPRPRPLQWEQMYGRISWATLVVVWDPLHWEQERWWWRHIDSSNIVTFGGYPWQRVGTIGESLSGVPYRRLRIQMVPVPGASSLSKGHMRRSYAIFKCLCSGD